MKKNKNEAIEYIEKTYPETVKEFQKLQLNTLTKYFEVSKKEVKEYIDLLDETEIKEILEMYGTDKNQIKRMVK